jgi:hypothetical protein
MKIIKVGEKGGEITRELISSFGNRIYQNDEIRKVLVRVFFKDGSELGFNRDEEEDEFEELFRAEKEKE